MRNASISLLCGTLAVPLGCVETTRWLFHVFRGRSDAYRCVPEIWSERSGVDLLFYVLGQLAYLAWPLVFCATGIGPPWLWATWMYGLWFAFIAFTVSTLIGPVGLCRRYRWLVCGRPLGYERVFVGQVPAYAVLHVTGRGTDALLREFGAVAVVLVLGPSLVNYGAWIGYRQNAFIVNEAIEVASITFWDFVYHSVITVTTTGYGDIVPHQSAAQLVSVSQVAMGWMYVIAFLPLVLSVLQQRSSGDQLRSVRDISRGGLLRATIKRGLGRLRDQRSADGSWCTPLSSDFVSAVFALWAIETSRRDLPIKESIVLHLREHVYVAGPTSDALGQALAAVHRSRNDGDTAIIVAKLLADHKGPIEVHASSEEFLLWLAYLVQQGLTDETQNQLTSIGLPSVEEWRELYGAHWSVYALAARLLVAHKTGNQGEVDLCAQELVDVYSDTGSWFGDSLLTSVCVLALAQADRQRTFWHGAVLWLIETASECEGMPVVRSLDVWHTALAIEILHYSGTDTAASVLWLQRRCIDDGVRTGWSWSSESKCLCLDSTSTILHAIRALEIKERRVALCAHAAGDTLSASVYTDAAGVRTMPTFLGQDTGIDPCPIVLSRSLTLLPLDPADRRAWALQIVQRVADGEVSPWFSAPCITKGLVLWHIGSYLPTDVVPTQKLVAELVAEAGHLQDGDNVMGGSILLGLLGSKHCVSAAAGRNETMERLVDRILASAGDGEWTGEAVGVFGFGRTYRDNHLATVLSLRSLMEYSCL